MKTIEQHLQDLPEPYRAQALKNMWWEDKDNRYELQSKALQQAFKWWSSNEGIKYWYDLHRLILEQEKQTAHENNN